MLTDPERALLSLLSEPQTVSLCLHNWESLQPSRGGLPRVPLLVVAKPDGNPGVLGRRCGCGGCWALTGAASRQCTDPDGRAVDRARAWCEMVGIQYFRWGSAGRPQPLPPPWPGGVCGLPSPALGTDLSFSKP